jgi:hypothetical protein
MRRFIVRELKPKYTNVLTPGFNRPLPELGERIQVECDGKLQIVEVTLVNVARNCFDCEEAKPQETPQVKE